MRDQFDWPGFSAAFANAAEACGFSGKILQDTVDGPVMAWERKGCGPVVYLSAGIHGDEPAGPLAALEMMERGLFSENFHWLVCPALNPGGLALGTRENRGGWDQNRDYLQLQTPETASHVNWLKGKPVPDLFVSMHEDWETAGFYLYEINTGCDSPSRSASILESVSNYFPAECGEVIDGHEVRGPGWIFHCAEADLPDSWPEAIWLAKHGCPLSFTFETPSSGLLPHRVSAHIAGFTSLLATIS